MTFRHVRGRRYNPEPPGQDMTANGNRGGFTLVEMLVAIIILAIGVLGLAGTSAVVLTQMRNGTEQSAASQIAADRFEYLSGRKCPTAAASGSRTARGVTETWSLTTGDNSTLVAKVSVTMSGRSTAETFSSVIACY